MASIFESSMHDSAYDEPYVQERREPRAAQSVSSPDRGLCRPRQSGSAIDSFVSALDLPNLGFRFG
jgi:hypothetical protein